MDWIRLDWIGLDWVGLDHGLDWIGLEWSGVEWIHSYRVVTNQVFKKSSQNDIITGPLQLSTLISNTESKALLQLLLLSFYGHEDRQMIIL